MRVLAAVSVMAALVAANANEVCQDSPLGWKDQDDDDCAKYKRAGWCGARWQSRYTDSTGKTADEACCGCGGGEKTAPQKMCREEMKTVCRHKCPSGWKEIGTFANGCCTSSPLACFGWRRICERYTPCPEMCKEEKKMACRQPCPSGWKQVRTEDHGCCTSTHCGGWRRVCEKEAPCGRRLADSEYEEVMTQPLEEAHENAEDVEALIRRLA